MRDRIFSVTKEILAAKGLAADLQEVIARVGVGASTVYRHFTNKEALYREVEIALVRYRSTSERLGLHSPQP